MKKAIDRFRDWLESNPKQANLLYITVTFTTTAISIALILIMALSGPSAGPGSAADEPGKGVRIESREDALDDQNSKGAPEGKSGLPITEASPENTPGAAPGTSPSSRPSLTLTVTDEEAAGLIAVALSKRIPIEDISVSFSSPNIMTISGKLGKSGIGALIDDKELPLIKAALILAPDSLDVSLALCLALNDDGRLSASPVKAAVNGINITRFIPQSAVDSANEALYDLLPDEVVLLSLSIGDGSATFTVRA